MPRTYTVGERALLAGDYNVLTRVELKRPTGAWLDVTAYTGDRNFFDSFKWSRAIDAPVMTGTLDVLREVLGVSIAPLIGGSALNNVGLTYAPILTAGNAVRVSTACVAVGAAAVAGDWKEMFLGRVDDPSVGGDEGLVSVAVSDLGAWLVDQNIDTERPYGSATGVPLETVIQAILTDNPSAPLNALLGGPVTLSTPISPAWNVKSFRQAKTNVLDAIRTLAQQIGWDVRFLYDAAGVYRLTLFQPQRTKTVADYSIAVRDYYAIPTLDTAFANVRTRVGGSYLDSTTHTRLTRYLQSDAAHTDQYGIRYMEVNEADTSNIDTAAEMDLMLSAMRSDLQDPPATHIAEMPYFWLAELGDLASHAANAVHYDSAQLLAVVGIEHTVTRDAQTTLLTTGGHVVGNNAEWIAKQADGSVAADTTADDASLNDVRRTDAASTATIYFTPGVLVAEVWAAYRIVNTPESAADWHAVAAAVAPLPDGATSYVVPQPLDKQTVLVQLEPRLADLTTAGRVRRITLTGAPQVPHVELDDLETVTLGTQWWKITERGIPVSAVQVQTQVGSDPASTWGPPTRGPGAASVVRGGVLAAGEYEHDILLDPSRQSFIMPRLQLANGAPPIVLGPFPFDRDKRPNLLSVKVSGTVIDVLADVDTRAIGVYSTTGAWKFEVDGVAALIDVAALGTNGVAGLASGSADTFTVKALRDPVVDIGGGTLADTRNVTISNGGAAPAATWVTVQALAPATAGDDALTITLQASAAPAGWTTTVWIANPSSGAFVDHTADLSPALSAPPTALTSYTFATGAARTSGGHSGLYTVSVRAELRDAGGVVRGTLTRSASWYTGGPL